ncbi:DUF6461 domain-containing protein [Rhodococcus erythropolis]|jgi:hypothetical protein|uniref:DUF6461 domain-containing protein n=1 Tax=Rhodococcus erythropolis TaxID=1833 RepID=UPI0008CBF2B2|nr:DUF6461 domain-containing protein [Rhodococcus erythropolis]MDF2470066.1 hypothetical protein [Rhodococcus erythropolis]OFV79295.1 hypothetical protein RERY_00520 [Rhodococcus erythropolis]
METYRDYEWLFRHYPWTENGLYVTYVRDATPAAVIEAMAMRELGGKCADCRGSTNSAGKNFRSSAPRPWETGRSHVYVYKQPTLLRHSIYRYLLATLKIKTLRITQRVAG